MTDGFCEQNNQTEATSRRTGAVLIPSLGGKLCMGRNDDEALGVCGVLCRDDGGDCSGCCQKKYGPGVSDAEIKIGDTMPYSGPASSYSNRARCNTFECAVASLYHRAA